MTAADGYLDLTITTDYQPAWCPTCAKPAAITMQAVITQQTNPTNVVGRHSFTRCVECEPYNEEQEQQAMNELHEVLQRLHGVQISDRVHIEVARDIEDESRFHISKVDGADNENVAGWVLDGDYQ